LAAAKQLRLAEVPVIVLGHLTEAQRQALLIADNQLALNAGWDEDLLRVELRHQSLKYEMRSLNRFSRTTLRRRQMDEEIRRKILTILDQHRIMTIAALRPDGWPQATTVGYASERVTLYFLCGPDSQ
jgi:ParB-like chromosome segregation protein Spo0J